MRKLLRAVLVVKLILVILAIAVRPKLRVWGATREEHEATYPGDDLVPDADPPSTYAATYNAPPAAIWPWLVQMGSDRGGFYSWDRLDNGGDPSADTIHPEWQDLAVGGRIATVPDRSWFDVPILAPEKTLVLRASLDLGSGLSFNPAERRPRAYMDGVWSFHLIPTGENQTRLIVRSVGTSKPPLLAMISDLFFFGPAHWIMQVKQLDELRSRVERN
ncbi:MAG: hypothetical protein JHC98_10400 [Thermoleophilaceae bacterium]|nr:hypothetical protein [Thermoleophilaceae bacterium]